MIPDEPGDDGRAERPHGIYRSARQRDAHHVAHEDGEADAQGRDVGGAVLLDGEEVDDEDELRREEDLEEETLRHAHAGAQSVGDKEWAGNEAVGQAGRGYAGYDLYDEDDDKAEGGYGSDETEGEGDLTHDECFRPG